MNSSFVTTKINGQIQLAANKDYTSTQLKWVTDEHDNRLKLEVAKRVSVGELRVLMER